MERLPLLSVVVPIYNVEPYLDVCIRSLCAQTYSNLEILLVDDGSTDGSGKICDAWAEQDSRIRVIHQKNGGAGKARNTALDQAAGELIGFVDGDDFLHPAFYRHLFELMTPETDIAECSYVETARDTAPFSAEDGQTVRCGTQEAMEAHIRDTMFRQLIWNKLYRREVVGAVRFPEGNLIDDEFWTYRVLGNAKELVHSDARLYAYRQQPGSAMHKPYSLKRLQGLDAKRQRLDYVRQRLPELEYEARFDLFFSCLYAMQGCQKSLGREEQTLAWEKIREILGEIGPLEKNPEATFLRNLLVMLARTSFRGTSRLLNFLIDIHVLT